MEHDTSATDMLIDEGSPLGDLKESVAYFRESVARLRVLNEGESPMRSRELSVAITHAETAALWLEQALLVKVR